jgi:hypothetical protein
VEVEGLSERILGEAVVEEGKTVEESAALVGLNEGTLVGRKVGVMGSNEGEIEGDIKGM